MGCRRTFRRRCHVVLPVAVLTLTLTLVVWVGDQLDHLVSAPDDPCAISGVCGRSAAAVRTTPPPPPPALWPRDDYNETDDRIIAQLEWTLGDKLRPTDDNGTSGRRKDAVPAGYKLIHTGHFTNHEKTGGVARFADCPVDKCYLSEGKLPATAKTVDAFLTDQLVRTFPGYVTNRTVTIFYNLESSRGAGNTKPKHTPFNWTATYRRTSTIVTPYERFVPYPTSGARSPDCPLRDYARTKNKMVAWFVSNCKAANGRLEFAKELAKHVSVDIYGKCGTMTCARRDSGTCFRALDTDYKFYLAFENTNCRDYITEKLYWNGLNNDVVPVVMGAHPDDYRKVAPPHSFIHVDDFESPRHLAEYLRKLDRNDTLYNEYFRWKGTGKFINTKFWCRVCAMLHARDHDNYIHWYPNLNEWWSERACVRPVGGRRWASWRDSQDRLSAAGNVTDQAAEKPRDAEKRAGDAAAAAHPPERRPVNKAAHAKVVRPPDIR